MESTTEDKNYLIATVAAIVIEDIITRFLLTLMPECPYCKSKLDVISAGKGYTCMKCGHRVCEDRLLTAKELHSLYSSVKRKFWWKKVFRQLRELWSNLLQRR